LKYQLQIAEANVLSAEAVYSLTLKGAPEEDIRAAEENLKQAETNLSQAKVDLDRFEYLFKNKAISNKQYEDAQYRQKIAEAQYSAALEQLKKIKNLARPEEVKNAFSNLLKAKANLEIIKQNIKDCYIISPLEGFIEKIFVEKGESVSQMSKICKIIDLKKLKVSIYLNEIDLLKIRANQSAKILTNSGYETIGKIIFISNEAQFTPKNILSKDEKLNLVYEVKISVENPDLKLKIGLPVSAIIQL